MPNQTIIATVAGPLNPPILGDFEAILARKSPRIGGLGGGSAGFVSPISKFGIRCSGSVFFNKMKLGEDLKFKVIFV
jgi:hypothetical protein